MSIRCSFMDNHTYGADDINFALSRLTTQGVSLFQYTDGDNPLLSLNDAIASYTAPGVELYNTDACKVTYDSTTNIFMISPGTAFMYDGSFISFEDDGYDLSAQVLELRKESEDTITVYLYRDIPENDIKIMLTTDATQIDEEKSVILASIDNDNEVLDLRSFAETKIAPATANIVKTFSTPQFSAYSPISVKSKLKATYTEIFSGAKYCYCYNQLYEIQKIATETGDELTFFHSPHASADEDAYVAFNMYNGELQLWSKGSSGGSTVRSNELYVF